MLHGHKSDAGWRGRTKGGKSRTTCQLATCQGFGDTPRPVASGKLASGLSPLTLQTLTEFPTARLMSGMIAQILQSLDVQQEAAIQRLFEFLRIPSVSAQQQRRGDVHRCAHWLAEQLQQAKMDVRVFPTAGHPVVVARNAPQPGRPTVLFYGHYDVQPAEPLNLWTSHPFEPTIRDGAIFARGSADDKGQIWAHIEAISAWQRRGGLQVNLIMLLEGEEEIGSPNLQAFIQEHAAELKADIALISDTNQFGRGIPAITYGLRGLVYEEIFLDGPSHDLHSGLFGGVVVNPANALVELLASLHDADGRVNIPGFYDDVVPLQESERQMWAKLPFSEGQLAEEVGVRELAGEKGFSVLERKWARPTCDVNGITAGYQGEGAKTVIAAKASAKVSMRLVPNQNPHKIREAFEKAIRDRCPAGISVHFENHGLAEPMLTPLASKAMTLAAEAICDGFGVPPTFMREGGTIPVVAVLKQLLGVDTLMVGFGLPDDRVHSPNEKFDVDAFHGGMRTAAALYAKLAQMSV